MLWIMKGSFIKEISTKILKFHWWLFEWQQVVFMICGCCFILWFAGPPVFFKTWLGQAICFPDWNRVKVSAKKWWDQSQSPHTHRRVSSYKNRGAICFQSWTVSMYHRLVMDFEHSTDWKVDLVFFLLLNTTVKNYLSFTCK